MNVEYYKIVFDDDTYAIFCSSNTNSFDLYVIESTNFYWDVGTHLPFGKRGGWFNKTNLIQDLEEIKRLNKKRFLLEI